LLWFRRRFSLFRWSRRDCNRGLLGYCLRRSDLIHHGHATDSGREDREAQRSNHEGNRTNSRNLRQDGGCASSSERSLTCSASKGRS